MRKVMVCLLVALSLFTLGGCDDISSMEQKELTGVIEGYVEQYPMANEYETYCVLKGKIFTAAMVESMSGYTVYVKVEGYEAPFTIKMDKEPSIGDEVTLIVTTYLDNTTAVLKQ